MIIPLTQGKEALIDDEDYDLIKDYKWYAHKNKNAYYATTSVIKENKKRTTLKMHQLILPADGNMEIDHINHNGLDNRKSNLRLCEHIQNCQNRVPNYNSSSLYKGVGWDKKRKRWQAFIKIKGRAIKIGYFKHEKEAAIAYDRAATKHFGAFAFLNEQLLTEGKKK